MYDMTEERDLTLAVPALTDEGALQISELLQAFMDRFDECYHRQIIRACRERDKERQSLYYQRWMDEAQQPLPFGEEQNILF